MENRGRKSRNFSLMRIIRVSLVVPAALASTGVFHLRSSTSCHSHSWNCGHVAKFLEQGEPQCVAHAVHALF